MSIVPDIFHISGDLLALSVIEISTLSQIFLLKRKKNGNKCDTETHKNLLRIYSTSQIIDLDVIADFLAKSIGVM